MLGMLGRKEQSDWPEMVKRVWTMFREVYNDVRTTGEFLFRGEPLGGRFPSLHAATRVTRRQVRDEGTGEVPVDPVDTPDPLAVS